MGCVNSKMDINDTHPNIFHVTNVNDVGRLVSRGKLEVTDTELIFHQKGKNPVKWPLRSLRKYGWDVDTNVFSMECGRRSPTGPGYYAFKCKKAEQLFNMVQQHIIGNVQENIENPNLINALNQNHIDSSVPAVSTGPTVQRRPDLQGLYTEGGHLNPVQPVTSNGQISPTAISPPAVITEIPPLEHNNNKRSSSIVENGTGPPTYANLSPCDLGDTTCHVYMNVDAKEIVCSLSQNNFVENREYQREISEEKHAYANIDMRDVESIHLLQQQHSITKPPNFPADIVQMYTSNSVPCTPTVFTDTDYVTIREVNYAELDLESSKGQPNYANTKLTQVVQQKPNNTGGASALTVQDNSNIKSYATIDFPKTIALSQSINPKADHEEGSRKTRHNSTINSFSD